MAIATDITLLVTHYNRPKSLERQLQAFRAMGVKFAKIVVSDDASKPQNLAQLHELKVEYGFELVTTPINKGLGNNINKGQDQAHTPYTLYVQEDFSPSALFGQRINDALKIMNEHQDVDLVRFFIQVTPPKLRSFKFGFSEMIFSLWQMGTSNFFCYSDTPHLRRQTFFQKFGRYKENTPAIKCEKAMGMSFLQSRGRGLVCDVSDVFTHENSHEEPSTQDYSHFFKVKRLIPNGVFNFLWMLKLSFQYLFVSYRN
jgi:glycosyltransferase involved in cell wall biosynthesis